MPLPWVWELEETQPKSSQYQAENPVLSLGKLTREASNFMAKGFPFARGGGGPTRRENDAPLGWGYCCCGQRTREQSPPPSPSKVNRPGK